MCGIVGYIGKRNAVEVLIPGLAALEERGYDSAGLLTAANGRTEAVKIVTRHNSPARELSEHPRVKAMTASVVGMAHTRWATHGAVSETNAHPHCCCEGRIWIVHNGIIENFHELRGELAVRHKLASETDSELIAHLIEEELPASPALAEAVRRAVRRLRGTWGLLVLDRDRPDELVAARHGSPLLLGRGEGGTEMFVASLQDAFLPWTRQMIELRDNDVVAVRAGGYVSDGTELREVRVDASEMPSSGRGEEHIMLAEIREQPEAVLRALNRGGRLLMDEGSARLGGLDHRADELLALEHLRLVACGTARHACEYGAWLLGEAGGFATVAAEPASEARPDLWPEKTGAVGVSQSGETMDTLEALRAAQRTHRSVFSIVNRVGTAIPRLTDLGVYTNSGPEKAVASTKAFTAQCVVFVLLALWFGQRRGIISPKEGRTVCRALMQLPDLIRQILDREEEIKTLAAAAASRENAAYVGRGICLPAAREGALKITEVAYLHAQAFAAGELKHGPIALIDKGFPVVALVQRDEATRMASCLNEVKARGALTVVIAEEEAPVPSGLADFLFRTPTTHPWLAPILINVPLQLIAYHAAVSRHINPDRPRNLAKSVTVG